VQLQRVFGCAVRRVRGGRSRGGPGSGGLGRRRLGPGGLGPLLALCFVARRRSGVGRVRLGLLDLRDHLLQAGALGLVQIGRHQGMARRGQRGGRVEVAGHLRHAHGEAGREAAVEGVHRFAQRLRHLIGAACRLQRRCHAHEHAGIDQCRR